MRKMTRVEAFFFKDQYLLNRMGYNMSFAEIGFVVVLATMFGLGVGACIGALV
jgi:hypothetical protein